MDEQNPLKALQNKHESQPAKSLACPACKSAVHWRDAYGRTHCMACERPPTAAMVRQKLIVVTMPDGRQVLEDFGQSLQEDLARRSFDEQDG